MDILNFATTLRLSVVWLATLLIIVRVQDVSLFVTIVALEILREFECRSKKYDSLNPVLGQAIFFIPTTNFYLKVKQSL